MPRRWILLLGILGAGAAFGAGRPASPDEIYGVLFQDVQRGRVFPDQKTFVDCVPREDPARILAEYMAERKGPGPPVDLGRFVREHFILPTVARVAVPPDEDLARHIATLWQLLRRAPDRLEPGSSLLPLPNPYIVPGGRFREVYYWDSYFTLLGLRESGDEELVASTVRNFDFLSREYGLIPNGNRTYYLSRSQPPFFALMVEFLAEKQGEGAYAEYRSSLQRELDYWMDRLRPTRHVVVMPDGGLLNRYYDQEDTPRPEAFAADEAVGARSRQDRRALYRNIRSAAESGWDFSTRWFADGRTLETIRTTEIVPVDLNCLLYRLERVLAKADDLAGRRTEGDRLEAAAVRRREEILRFCWSPTAGYFFDYDLQAGRIGGERTLAGMTPLFFRLATPAQARAVMETLQTRFLRPGGLVTTLAASGQQWDAPNGWAPLEWMAIRGLENYGYHAFAADIARRWIKLNRDVYRQTGRLMEKYNVEDPALPGGGGEYPAQDGFGWTNGVLLGLMREYPAEDRPPP